MKALIINRDLSVTEYEGEPDGWMDSDISWDATSLDEKHYIYFDDDAMADANVVYTQVGKHRRIPLPAYVIGIDGENTGEVELSVSELEKLIS